MQNIRRAKTDESQILTSIAIRAEAYWGYDSDYMEEFNQFIK